MIPIVAEALVIIDYQNDFAAPDGALSVAGGEEIAERINELARSGGYDLVVATRDWHPPDHNSFKEQGGIWPVHCVQGSPGAELHPALEHGEVDIVFDKGQDQKTDGYSAFETPELAEYLRDREIDNITVVGLATDYCVKNTALDALRDGFAVRVDSGAVRGVDVNAGDAERALDEMRDAGAQIT
jgi:nicotinamidase/pyrazinamidase